MARAKPSAGVQSKPEGGGESLLLPFTKAVAVEIDFLGGRIVIELPDEIEGEES